MSKSGQQRLSRLERLLDDQGRSGGHGEGIAVDLAPRGITVNNILHDEPERPSPAETSCCFPVGFAFMTFFAA